MAGDLSVPNWSFDPRVRFLAPPAYMEARHLWSDWEVGQRRWGTWKIGMWVPVVSILVRPGPPQDVSPEQLGLGCSDWMKVAYLLADGAVVDRGDLLIDAPPPFGRPLRSDPADLGDDEAIEDAWQVRALVISDDEGSGPDPGHKEWIPL